MWANQARRDRLVEKISRQLTEFTGSVFSAWTRHVEEEQRTRAQKVAKRESMLRQMVAGFVLKKALLMERLAHF